MKAYLKNHKHFLAMLYIPVYLVWFILIERRPMPEYYVVYSPLDDYIPFCEWFIIPYGMWYGYMFAVGLYLMFTERKEFGRYCAALFTALSLCLLISTVFPNGQDLRPAVFPRENILTTLVGGIYAADTNTNVLPSMHVIASMLVHASVWQSSTPLLGKRWVKVVSLVLCILICVSTVFVKQHSILDGIASVVLFIPFYILVYRRGRKTAQNPLKTES